MSSGACSTAPAARQQLSIDISPTRRSAANPQAAIAAVGRWDKQTDIQTDKQTNGRSPTVTFPYTSRQYVETFLYDADLYAVVVFLFLTCMLLFSRILLIQSMSLIMDLKQYS